MAELNEKQAAEFEAWNDLLAHIGIVGDIIHTAHVALDDLKDDLTGLRNSILTTGTD